MHSAEIQAALKVRGYSQAVLADEVGVKPAAVSMVINGRGRSAQIEARIAAITGYTLEELWPQWHGKPPLVLSDEERALVLLCRELPPGLRVQVLPTVRAMARDADNYKAATAGSVVIATHGSAAAGGNQTINPPPRRKR